MTKYERLTCRTKVISKNESSFSFRAAGAFSKSAKYTIVDFRLSATIFEIFWSQNLRPSRGDLEPEFELRAAGLGSGVLGPCGGYIGRSFCRVGFDVIPLQVG